MSRSTNTMRVVLQNITKEPEQGRVRITIQFGDEPPKQFLGSYDGGDEKYKFCTVEQELFMRLSDLATRKYCNCAVYQMELMGIIGAFVSGQQIPPFPIELGMTAFGFKRPSQARILFDRVRKPFYLAWHRWKTRHARRERLLKYGKASNR
jgi:hypothetical protein